MGTSTSSKGPGGNSPFVPGWVDTDGQQVPEAPPQRFKDFRTNLGRFVSTGDGDYLRSAISSYAGGATGGSGIDLPGLAPWPEPVEPYLVRWPH